MKVSFASSLKALPPYSWNSDIVSIRPISNDDDLWYVTVECHLLPEQEDFVNPAGFSIGRAYLNPEDHLPCVICRENGHPIGFIVLRKWPGAGEEAYNWSYYIDKDSQGLGYGKAAAALAVKILKEINPDIPIKLSTEVLNSQAQRLYESVGFVKSDEMDGDDLVYVL